MRQVYVCRDTITGLFSALHDAWKENRDSEAEIEIEHAVQRQLFCEYKTVKEDSNKAMRLGRMIKRHLGYNAFWDIYLALLSGENGKGTAVFRTMQEARKIGNSRKIMEHLVNSDVAQVFAMSRQVSNEAHMYEEVIRFRELENGVLFYEITPKSQILTCIGDHFADRFPLENWMIYDKTHEVFLVHEKQKQWVLVWGERPDREQIKRISNNEKEYARLWKGFFHSVSVKDRENPGCQRNHLPLRYRPYMTEFQDGPGVKEDERRRENTGG